MYEKRASGLNVLKAGLTQPVSLRSRMSAAHVEWGRARMMRSSQPTRGHGVDTRVFFKVALSKKTLCV